MKSIGQKIRQIEGLLGTSAVTKWETEFIESISRQSEGGKSTLYLTEPQIHIVDRIYGKHFA